MSAPSSPQQSVLHLDNVEVTYHRRDGAAVRAVRGVDLVVHAGEVVGLVGESGCGKSSLGRAAVGLEKLAAGSVTFGGKPVQTLGRRARPAALRSLQLLFQDPYSSLNPRRKIGHQLRTAYGHRARRQRVLGSLSCWPWSRCQRARPTATRTNSPAVSANG